MQYDVLGRLTRISANSAERETQAIELLPDQGGATTLRDSTGRQVTYQYNSEGLLAQFSDGAGRKTRLAYNGKLQATEIALPGGAQYRYTYYQDRVASQVDPLGAVTKFVNAKVHSSDNDFVRLGSLIDAHGNITGFRYGTDRFGEPDAVLERIHYADLTVEQFFWQDRELLSEYINRRDQPTYLGRDGNGLITNVTSFVFGVGWTTNQYQRDAAGHLASASGPGDTNSITCDPITGWLTRIEYPGGIWFTLDYDAVGRRIRRTGHDGYVLGYEYDDAGRLARMTNGLGQLVVAYDYDPAGRFARKTLGNGVYTTFTNDAAGQLTALVNHKPDGTLLSSFDYTYDAAGRPASLHVRRGYAGLAADETQNYQYDAVGQLTRVEYSAGRVVNYEYDAVGNRTRVTDSGVVEAYVANSVNAYTSVGAAQYLYDRDGNLTNKTANGVTIRFEYDTQNRLVTIVTPTNTWRYAYDSLGNRVSASCSDGTSRRYIIDPVGFGNVVAELDGSGQLLRRYDHGYGLVSRTESDGTSAAYSFTPIGHTSELVDVEGNPLNAYSYDPWGQSLGAVENVENPFQFVGEYGVMQAPAGLHYMRARQYDCRVGRFVQNDPIGIEGGLNLYGYAGNAPVWIIDPSGLVPNGCGVPGELSGLAPDWPFGVPCDMHDNCYEGVGKYKNFAKEECDEMFYTEMKKIAFQSGVMNAFDVMAFSYHAAVVLGGDRAFHDARYPFVGPPTPSPFHDGLYYPPGGPLPDGGRPPTPPPNGNGSSTSSTIVSSFDPNDKLAPAGYGASAFVQVGDMLVYEVRFENRSDATAPAREIVIRDTLDANLDMNTLEFFEMAFGPNTLQIPAGLDQYDALVPINSRGTDLLVDVSATLDRATRTLSVTFSALDPVTGWYPEDPLLGLLPPEDGTGAGQGHIIYLVRPMAGLPTGTVISNRATIVFDYNDPIDTPVVFNSIDSTGPASSVTALPPEVGRTFLVRWSGQDDLGGCGLANYDVLVSTNGTNFMLWLMETTNTSGWFAGLPGRTYWFRTAARDWVGNAATSSTTVQTTVATNAPVLAAIATNVFVYPNDRLTISNRVTGGSGGGFHFTLAPGALTGAGINPTNGVFTWTPTCADATRTNQFTVWLADAGNTNWLDAMTFKVVVGECVVPSLGRLVMRGGENARVPVRLISTVPLANLSMTLEAPERRVTNLWVEPLLAEICGSGLTGLAETTNLHSLSFTTCSNLFLLGTQQVAWLHFTAVSNQTSAFVNLNLDNAVGIQPNGTEVRNFAPQSGRLVIIGEEPLLELLFGTNGYPALVLYGKPAWNCDMETRPRLDSATPWQLYQQTVLEDLFQSFDLAPATNSVRFFRAVRK